MSNSNVANHDSNPFPLAYSEFRQDKQKLLDYDD